MNINTALEIFNTIVLGGWASFGMLCALQWWQERKDRAEDSRAFRQAVSQVSVNHLNTAKAEAWEVGFTEGAAYYHESGKEPAAFTETAATLNPYKEQA